MMSLHQDSHSELRQIFVGRNYDYYARKWERLETQSSWNWAAFFLILGWMAYRKLYLHAWIFFSIIFIETLLVSAFGFPNVFLGFNLVLACLCGSTANRWYLLLAEKKIADIAPPELDDDEARARLAKAGGTNIASAVGFGIGLLLLLLFAGLLFRA